MQTEKEPKDPTETLRSIFKKISVEYEIDYDWKVYSPEERKEEYCENALALATFEGDWYRVFNIGYSSDYKFHSKIFEVFQKMLEEEGYFYELGEAWYLGIYKK